jgi:hypothetical protein
MLGEIGIKWQVLCMRIMPSYPNFYQNLGEVGKNNQKKILPNIPSPPDRAASWLLCLLLLGGCHSELSNALQSGEVHSWNGLEGRWVGEVTPAAGSCGPTTKGLMTIGEHGFAFDPFQGAEVVRGDVAKDTRLVGRTVRTGPGHQDLSVTFEGTASTANNIEGLLQSGRCRWTVALHRG